MIYPKTIAQLPKQKYWVILEDDHFSGKDSWGEDSSVSYMNHIVFTDYQKFIDEITLREKTSNKPYSAFEVKPVVITREIQVKVT